jgi:hypothetical protein
MTSRTRYPAIAPRSINRRSFLQAGATAAAMPLLGMAHWLPAPPAANDSPSRIQFHKVLFDRDHPAALAFGRAGQAAGLPVEPIGADVTALWRDLLLRWRREQVAMAGLTTEPVALYLQLFAQDAGLRLVFRASHTPLSDRRVRHYLSGPRATLRHLALLDTAEGWPLGALALLCRCTADLASKATLMRTSPSGRASAFPQGRLVSWVLAPVARNQHGYNI